jgi:hypothetical protein
LEPHDRCGHHRIFDYDDYKLPLSKYDQAVFRVVSVERHINGRVKQTSASNPNDVGHRLPKRRALIRYGSTRTVALIWRWAVKVGHGDEGARCNREEADLYARSNRHRQPMLCPILWCSRYGKLLIARRAETPITQVQLDGLKLYHQAWNEWDYRGPDDDECPFEWKTSDWGMFDSRLVAVDYAATARWTCDAH